MFETTRSNRGTPCGDEDSLLAGDSATAAFRDGDCGMLSISLSTDGQHVIATSSTLEQALGMRLAADGKIVLAGRLGNNFAVWRLNTDGSADTTFNTTGVVTTDVLGVSAINIAHALAIGPDYKITAVGRTGVASIWAFGIARYKVSSGLEERLYAKC